MKDMKTILYIVLIFGSISHILNGQAHQVIDGPTQSSNTVLQANVKYQGEADVIAVHGTSFPVIGEPWGIGGQFQGGYYGVYAEVQNDFGRGAAIIGTGQRSAGIHGVSKQNIGIMGSSTDSTGVYGLSTNHIGVYGYSTSLEGVSGESLTGTGIFAKSNSGLGLFASSNSGISVQALSQTNTAINAASTSGDEAVRSSSFAPQAASVRALSYGKGSTGVSVNADSIGTYSEADGINSVGVYAKGNRYGIRASGFTAGLFEGSIEVSGSATIGGGVFSGGVGRYTGQVSIKQVNGSDQNYSTINGLRLDHHSAIRWWTMYLDRSNNDLNFEDTGILRAYIDNGNGNFSITSDRRLKEQISPLGSVLPEVMQLEPATYFYKSDPTKDVKSLGFIAQEVEAVFPELVKEKNGIKTLAYDNFAILSIKAIQEQQAHIESLESEVQTLKELIEQVMESDK